MITVFITDFETGRQDALILTPSEFTRLTEAWQQPDALLAGLQHTAAFEGRTRWGDLDPQHWRFLIGAVLDKWVALPEDERLDTSNKVVDSVGFLMCGYVACMQHRADCRFQVMDVTRIPGVDVIFRFVAVTATEIDPPKRTGLRVIDNTRS